MVVSGATGVSSDVSNIPIAITGMHRSGTSMITRALHDSGLHLIGTDAEELLDAADDNPEGFWENKAIVACNDALLEATGGAWDNPPQLPPQAVDDPRVTHVAEAATAAIVALSQHDHWGFKDPRSCLTAAYWLDLVPELRFVICVRDPLEVALSLKRRNQNSYSLGLALWERYYTAVLAAIPPDRRIVTHYDTYFLDPEGEIGRVCGFVGLSPAPPHVRSDLRHHTIGVGLVDAGVSPSLRSLYTDLCREAGVSLPPDSPPDEGRVRRLILDGAVAARHADQRRAAIDRIQEREDEFRARISELERQVATSEAVRAETVRAMRALDASVAQLRHEFAGGAIRRAARRLPLPVKQRLLRLANLGGRGSATGRTARVAGNGFASNARSASTRLPPPARRKLGRGRAVLRRAVAAPVPTAKAAARRLPPEAQEHLRRAWGVAVRLRQERGSRVPGRASQPGPKGPRYRKWKRSYERMVAATVPECQPWLVITPGSPKRARDARAARATSFPGDGSLPFSDDLAHIAQLEARRFQGYRHLVLPEGSRGWFRQRAELRDHIVRTYRTVVDEEGAGAVFDLADAAVEGARSLRGEVVRLAAGLSRLPAVLDWTELDLAGELPGLATFRPPEGDRLPYLDGSVDIVVVDEAHALDDARRVASLGVIVVAHGATGVSVESVEDTSVGGTAPALRILVFSAATGSDTWTSHLAARAAEAGAELRIAVIDAPGLCAHGDHDVVIVVEPNVLPLPGAIEAAAALAASRPGSAVAGKVVRADGTLESAGGTVFGDRSVALIAESSADVRAPWHDFVRPVCWAPGVVAAAGSLWASVPGPETLAGRPFLREWCAEVWRSGGSVVYQPTVTAVRVAGDGSEQPTPLDASSWQRVLDLRPARPRDLNDDAWRYLLAHDDVEACGE